NDGALLHSVACGVTEPGLRGRIDARAGGAAVQRPVSAHFEEIHEVGAVLEAHGVAQRPLAIIVESDALVAGTVPQEDRAYDVLRFTHLDEMLAYANFPVRHIHDERRVIVPESRTQEDRAPAVEQQPPARQYPGVAEVQTIRAPGALHDVAAIVEQGEAFAVLQRIGPGI